MADLLYNLKYFRKLKGYSQKDMAKLLKNNPSTYSKMEAGSIEISTNRLLEIAKVLGKNPEDFFAADPQKISSNKQSSENVVLQIQTLKELCSKNDILIKSLQENVSLLKEKIETLKGKNTQGNVSKSKKKR